MVHPYHIILLSNKKNQTIETGNNLEWISRELLSEKKNPKRLHTISFHIYNIFEITKL